MNLLTIDLIRSEIADTSVADNMARMRLTFTDEEIQNAINRCARNYNGQAPFIGSVSASAVPDSALFIEGTIAALYRVGLHRLRRNYVETQAGNSATSFTKTQIEQFEKIVKESEEKFQQGTHDIKMHYQINSAFGTCL